MDPQKIHRTRRLFVMIPLIVIALTSSSLFIIHENTSQPAQNQTSQQDTVTPATQVTSPAHETLATLIVKGRAPNNDYSRDKFGNGWNAAGSCDVRNVILARDLTNIVYQDDTCIVQSGTLQDPYTGTSIAFMRGSGTSATVQIDHVVALSDAWQKGAQNLSYDRRRELANDPLELLAVDGASNMKKSNGDAATWLPPNKAFRCQYVARQIAVKQKYELWVTEAERNTMQQILNGCPNQLLPQP